MAASVNHYRLYWKKLHFLIHILCIYIFYMCVVTSGIGKTSNFSDLLEIYFLEQTSSIWKQLWSNDNCNTWRQNIQFWFRPKSRHNRDFKEGWHLHQENKVIRAPKMSQSLISIKDNCSNVTYLNYHHSLSNFLNTITCVQSCGP